MADPGAFIWKGRLFKGGAFIRTNTVCVTLADMIDKYEFVKAANKSAK